MSVSVLVCVCVRSSYHLTCVWYISSVVCVCVCVLAHSRQWGIGSVLFVRVIASACSAKGISSDLHVRFHCSITDGVA